MHSTSRDNRILLKIKEAIVLFGLFFMHLLYHRLFMIAIIIRDRSIHVVVHKSLPLEEVLTALFLLDLFLTLVQGLSLLFGLLFLDHTFLKFLQKTEKLYI